MDTKLLVKNLLIKKDDKEILLTESEIKDLQRFLQQIRPTRGNVPLLLLQNSIITSDNFEFGVEEITKEQFENLITERVGF